MSFASSGSKIGRLFVGSLVLAVVGWSGTAWADIVWDGDGTGAGAWTDNANWNDNRQPDTGDQVNIDNGDTVYINTLVGNVG